MAVLDYKNAHDGERVFLLGNGPSLEITPLHLLEEEITMAMNCIDLIYDETDWRPNYYLNVERPGNHENDPVKHTKTHIDIDIPLFISADKEEFLPDSERTNYIRCDTINPDDY
jgi:hypothetical protein